MTRDKQRLPDYLDHILEAIDRIERYTEQLDESAFYLSEMAQDAVIRNLEVIGEASRNIQRDYPAFSDQHPQLPLRFAHEMRNALAHAYFKVDLRIVWSTVKRELPALRRTVREVREKLPS